jgi:hypothetical protein
MKTPLAGPNAMSRIRVFLIATCIIAVTPRLSADIVLLSRLSDAEAAVYAYPIPGYPPPQSQTGFLPANLRNVAHGYHHCPLMPCDCYGTGSSTSNSSILINSPREGLRVVGDGTASVNGCGSVASAKLIVLSFTLTDVSYPYLMIGQLNENGSTATLTGETGTIFERVGTITLSESGTLPPGNYTLSVNVSGSSSASFTFTLDGPVSVTRATNLSTRLLVGTGNDVGIGGFIVTGNGPRHVLLRGTGPSLSQFGVPNALADPVLELHGPSGFATVTNDNWRDTQEAEIIATGRAPSNDLESAIVADLAPGAYTAIMAGNAGATGIGLLEVFDLSPDQDSRLSNISTRANVGTADDIVIGGFVPSGGTIGTTILRGLGPSLSGTGISALADPKLELRNSQGWLIASDDNWMDYPNQAAIIQAAGLAPSNPLESAIAAILLPGTYTVLLSGVNNETGMGLVEVYDNPTLGPVPTPTPGGVPTPTATPSLLPHATNLSTRMRVQTGDGVAIAGFIVTSVYDGAQYLIRGIGPSLSDFGVPNPLADPVLEVHGGFGTITNDNWRDRNEAAIIATGHAPSNDLEAAILSADFFPGAYTAILSGNAGTTGVGLVELYDVNPTSSFRLGNISTRANVGTGDDVVIAGFILGAGGDGEDAIILRGLGPSLSGTGISPLADPKLELRDSQGGLIASDDNWMDDPNQASVIQKAGLGPSNNLESAIAATLMPGVYTVLLSGVNNGTGVGLVEVYDLHRN